MNKLIHKSSVMKIMCYYLFGTSLNEISFSYLKE